MSEEQQNKSTEVDVVSNGGAENVDHHGHIEQVDLQTEMQRSYLDYAMAVIIGRALPDVRDGLKPVHRRVIYAMYDGGYRPDRSFNKCARVVGDVMGQFHPHGDRAIYDTLVRLIQSWIMRYPLALGQGNFGSPGNDGAAALDTPRPRWLPLPLRWCVTSTKTLLISSPTTTASPWSLPFCRTHPEPAGQRFFGYCCGYGDQYSAA